MKSDKDGDTQICPRHLKEIFSLRDKVLKQTGKTGVNEYFILLFHGASMAPAGRAFRRPWY